MSNDIVKNYLKFSLVVVIAIAFGVYYATVCENGRKSPMVFIEVVAAYLVSMGLILAIFSWMKKSEK